MTQKCGSAGVHASSVVPGMEIHFRLGIRADPHRARALSVSL